MGDSSTGCPSPRPRGGCRVAERVLASGGGASGSLLCPSYVLGAHPEGLPWLALLGQEAAQLLRPLIEPLRNVGNPRLEVWRRKWQPIPVLLPGEPNGQRSLAATVHGSQRVGHDRSDLSHTFLSPAPRRVGREGFPSEPAVQFSCSVVSDSLRPHGQQHTRPPCPSPTPGVYSDSCPLNQ